MINMNKEQLLKRFEDMASSSMEMINEFGTDIEQSSVIELTTLVWAVKEMTELKEIEMEKIIKRETGFNLDDLMQIEESFYN